MINLWTETIGVLERHGRTWDDVRFIRGEQYNISKPNFRFVAMRTDYDNGFGAQKVASDLVVVGDDFWLERTEYDGAEDWQFKTAPTPHEETSMVHRLAGGAWSTLWELNDEEYMKYYE